MNALDTSVVIAAFAEWHGAHQAARKVLDLSARLPAHAALEAYSVLTRLPPPHRSNPGEVRDFLAREFSDSWLTLSAPAIAKLIVDLAASGIVGGATYDCLIGVTAKEAGATLFTCDRRARLVYERLGVDARFVG